MGKDGKGKGGRGKGGKGEGVKGKGVKGKDGPGKGKGKQTWHREVRPAKFWENCGAPLPSPRLGLSSNQTESHPNRVLTRAVRNQSEFEPRPT